MVVVDGIIIAYGAIVFLALMGTLFGYVGILLMTRKHPHVNTLARETVNRYTWLSFGGIVFEILAVVFNTLAYATYDIPRQGFDVFRGLYRYMFYTAATLFFIRSFHFSYLMIKRCAQTSILSWRVANFFKWTFRLLTVCMFILWIMVFAEPLFLGFIPYEQRTDTLGTIADIVSFIYGIAYISLTLIQWGIALATTLGFAYAARKQRQHATTFAQESMQLSGRTMKALFATQFLTLVYCLIQSILFIVDWTTHSYPSMFIQEWYGSFVLRVTAVVIFNVAAQISLNPRLLSEEKPAAPPVVVEEGMTTISTA